ncbi:MAG: hypothetical protein OXT73_10260 [Bacteroidota bacterium]|nr:hypothetical protein [Bacteroidota bacterium]
MRLGCTRIGQLTLYGIQPSANLALDAITFVKTSPLIDFDQVVDRVQIEQDLIVKLLMVRGPDAFAYGHISLMQQHLGILGILGVPRNHEFPDAGVGIQDGLFQITDAVPFLHRRDGNEGQGQNCE